MRVVVSAMLETCRVTTGVLASTFAYGMNGAFVIPYPNKFYCLTVIASDGLGWDHVSVSCPNRCPNWEEMKYVKELFFTDDEPAFQIYPPKSLYRNLHPYCLHWWRPQELVIPLPLPSMVAPDAI